MMEWLFRNKKFNQSIFKLSKSVKINFKIYGELQAKEEVRFKPYSSLLLNVLKNAHSISKEVDIKFKRRSDNIECEVNFLGHCSLGKALEDSKFKYFKDAFSSFQQMVENKGSEIVLINQYDSTGKVISSGINFNFPIKN